MALGFDHAGDLIRLGAPTHGCVTRQQLLANEYTDRDIRALKRSGLLRSVLAGVYVIASVTLTRVQAVQVALLAAGHGAYLAERTALELWQVAKPDRSGRLWVALASGQRRTRRATKINLADTGRPAIIYFVRPRRSAQVEHAGGFPAAPVPRALGDAAARDRTIGRVRGWIREADARKLLRAQELADELSLRRPGSKAVRADLPVGPLRSAVAGDSESRAEAHLLRALLDAGVTPPLVNRTLRVGDFECRPDMRWVLEGLIAEVDGPQHELPSRRAEDQARDAVLAAAGNETMRFPTRDVWRDVHACVARICAALERRRRERAPSLAPAATA